MDNVLNFPKIDRLIGVYASSPASTFSPRFLGFLTESFPFKMRELHNDILKAKDRQEHPLIRSVRPFRQRFCALARRRSSLSVEQLCDLLNADIRIQKLRKLPGGQRVLPLQPEFIRNLETNILAIIEYNPYGGGFLGLGAYGVPTSEIAEVIAEVCLVKKQYRRFEHWCEDYLRADHGNVDPYNRRPERRGGRNLLKLVHGSQRSERAIDAAEAPTE